MIAAMLVGMMTLAIQQPTTLGDGLTGYWKLDEAGGTTAVDSTANGFHGTWVGGVSAVAPANATMKFSDPACVLLNGSTGYVTVPNSPELNITGDISIAMWVNPTVTVADYIRLVGKGNTSIRTYGVYRTPSNNILWQSLTPDKAVQLESWGTTVPNNAWTHVLCTISGSTASIYLNGVLNTSMTILGTPVATDDPLMFGGFLDTTGNGKHTFFPGRLDEIRVYHRALTPEEINGLAKGYGNSEPDAPTALKQFDPAVSTTVEIVPGATLTQRAVEVHAVVSSPTSLTVKLTVEVRPVGASFSNVANATGALVASGNVASVQVTGLSFGQDYHWQVQAVDSGGRASSWTSYGTNPDAPGEKDFGTGIPSDPPVLASPRQLNPSTNTPIASGAELIDDSKVRIQATLSDPNSAQVILQVEFVPAGAPFRGVPTASSTLVASGEMATLDVPLAPGSYDWQARPVNQWGVSGSWTPHGGHPDLVMISVGSSGTGCGGSAGFDPRLIVLFAGLLLLRRRRSPRRHG